MEENPALPAHAATPPAQNGTDPASLPWWRGAAIYQIYPRSFMDSNGDGIGDLPGIIERLDHVASLGVDGIWLSPFFTSPMNDFGYDIADFCDVDPLFGSLQDFDRLIERAHALGLRVMIDQVYSHTSYEHPWFTQSRQDKDNAKADWYVWADPKADGSPPNNWQSNFSGSAWTWDSRRNQYYLHNFLASQPDLNLHNRAVQDAVLAVGRFWLDRGVDGFRLDALNFSMHDRQLRDNPAATRFKHPPKRPFDYQEHKYNQSQPEIIDFVARIRALTDRYPGRFTVAEVGGPFPLAEMQAFTYGDEHLNSAYSFEFLYAGQITAGLIRDALREWPGSDHEGWPSWAFSNHDAPRAVSRWYQAATTGDLQRHARLLALTLVSLRGNIFIYQGEELAMPQADIPYASLQDPEALANWPQTFGRDGARTPIPWDASQPHAGFSTGTPWLPVVAPHFDCAVAAREAHTASVLHFFRAALALRKHSAALRLGSLTLVESHPDLLVIQRQQDDEKLLAVMNLTADTLPVPAECQQVNQLMMQVGDYSSGNKELQGFSAFIGRV